MKKKTLTPEQTAARDARRNKFRALSKEVAAMTDEQRAELSRRMGALLTCEGRALSLKNCCLLCSQMPRATIVGGFRQWLKQGRAVKKGEHGAQIWIPLGGGKVDTDDGGDGEEGGVRFGMATVFDVSQTQELGGESPVAVVSPEIADAFGMRDLPNVVVDEEPACVVQFQLE